MTIAGVNMEATSKITLLFMSFGALAGCASGIISSAGAALLIFIILYYGSYRVALSMFGIAKPPSATPASPPTPAAPKAQQAPDKRKILTSGFTPYFAMWLILWIAVYTLKLTM